MHRMVYQAPIRSAVGSIFCGHATKPVITAHGPAVSSVKSSAWGTCRRDVRGPDTFSTVAVGPWTWVGVGVGPKVDADMLEVNIGSPGVTLLCARTRRSNGTNMMPGSNSRGKLGMSMLGDGFVVCGLRWSVECLGCVRDWKAIGLRVEADRS